MRLAGDETGATAVEFALIALPFFALILATIETALVFFAGQALETAVATAARTIRTGQAQSQSLSPADFKTSVCSQLLYLFNCDAGLYIDVKTYANFGAITLGVPVDANGNLKKTDYSYTPATAATSWSSTPITSGRCSSTSSATTSRTCRMARICWSPPPPSATSPSHGEVAPRLRAGRARPAASPRQGPPRRVGGRVRHRAAGDAHSLCRRQRGQPCADHRTQGYPRDQRAR
ncbi:MAG: TadE/TadG family type IV pilus assembly protein [Bauldia sp.]